MKINIILDPRNAGWILEKFAHRLHENILKYGYEATIGTTPDPTADINHFMSYAFAVPSQSSKTSFFITHIDEGIN